MKDLFANIWDAMRRGVAVPKPLGICTNCGGFVFPKDVHRCGSDGK